MISELTPVTISIITIESWSVSSVRPKWYGPALSQVHDVVAAPRCDALLPAMSANAMIAATNAPIVVTVET
jgi:hypothetical protein